MSTPTFSQLISPNNATYWEGQLLNNNDGVSGLAQPPNALPTNSWVFGDPILSFLKIDAAAFADEDQAIANIAKGGYLSTAADPSLVAASGPFAGTSPWLTLWAHEMYAIDRSPATTTTGHVVLTPNANASPIPIVPGQLIVSDGANPPHYFTNTTGGTLAAAAPSAPPLVLTFAAQSPGSGYNLGDGATLVLVTALPGVGARTFSPGWLITTGNDIQTDAELILECQNSWATLGTGSPAGAYVTWALEAYLAPGCAAASSVERAVTSADSGTSATSCFSDTLGRSVVMNTCVQSASDGDWYQCDDASWVDRATDPAACVAVYPLGDAGADSGAEVADGGVDAHTASDVDASTGASSTSHASEATSSSHGSVATAAASTVPEHGSSGSGSGVAPVEGSSSDASPIDVSAASGCSVASRRDSDASGAWFLALSLAGIARLSRRPSRTPRRSHRACRA